jgi:phage baseplate assembly protein W
MPKPFLGVGWGFPVGVDAQSGKISVAAYEESVRQSVWIILGTAKGERVMRPDFGCGIYDLVFENVTASTTGRIVRAVREALLMFETRIDVLDVQVRPENDGEVLMISVDYEVRATNNVFNLVYPFYLERSAG